MKKISIKEALAKLGNTPNEIARSLKETECCDGKRGNPETCPIAYYVHHYCATWPGAKVDTHALLFFDSQICDFTWPKPVAEFIKNFDAGQYPFLEK